MTQTVLVTGGSGFIGSHCILQLLAAGYQVRTTIRNLKREGDVRAMLKAGGAEPGEEFLGRGDGRRNRGIASPGLRDEPHDADDLLVETQRHRHVIDRGERPVKHE